MFWRSSPAHPIWGLFSPGDIDHHNLQIALTLWTLVFLIEQRPVAMAFTVAASLAIGLETLPFALVAINVELQRKAVGDRRIT